MSLLHFADFLVWHLIAELQQTQSIQNDILFNIYDTTQKQKCNYE